MATALTRRNFLAFDFGDRRGDAAHWVRIHRVAMACRFEVMLSSDDAGQMQAARVALDEAVRLMRAGQMTGAAEAARVADVMARAAARLEGDAAADPGEPDEAAFEAVRRKVEAMIAAARAEGAREAEAWARG